MISKGNKIICLEDILKKVSEFDILSHYLGITEIPTVIKSPFREDKNPSFGLYSPNGRIYYHDFSIGDRGGVIDLLMKLWNCSYNEALIKIDNDIITNKSSNVKLYKHIERKISNSAIDIKCRTRNWQEHDVKYWKSYGVSLKWLKYAEVYPISHIIIVKNDNRSTFTADKYAYCFIERKNNKVTLKIYQPYSKSYKWLNANKIHTIGLWTKVPKTGNKICICSSLKDSLCLWENIGIPSIYLQGEGYSMSDTAIKELKERFINIYILFDNDPPGMTNAKKLSDSTGFINIILPKIEEQKDISDLYKKVGKQEFIKIMTPLFKNKFIAYT